MHEGIELRLERLRELFELTPFDIDVLLVCMAVEFDLRYEKLYGYLQDDVTKKKPSVELLLNLLAPSFERNINARHRLSPEAPLLRFRLVELVEDPSHLPVPLLSRFVKVDDRIVQYLLDGKSMDEHIRTFVELMDCDDELERLPVDDDLKLGLMRLARNTPKSQNVLIHLKGPSVTDKQGAAQAVCHYRNQHLLIVDLEHLAAEPEAGFAQNLVLIYREARLQQSALFWKGVESLQGEQPRGMLNAFIRSLKHGCSMIFLDGELAAESAHALREITYFTVPMSRPSFTQRSEIWRAALEEYGSDIEASDMAELSVKFKFSPSQIRNAATTAANLALWREQDAQRITIRDLYEACRTHSNQKLSSLAHKIPTKYRWDDIVLPADRTEQLREICNHVKYRDQVLATGDSTQTRDGQRPLRPVCRPLGHRQDHGRRHHRRRTGLWISTRSTFRSSSANTSARPRRTSRASSTRPRPRTPFYSLTKPMRYLASAARSRTRTTAMPTSKSATCFSASKSMKASSSWRRTSARTWTTLSSGACTLPWNFRFPNEEDRLRIWEIVRPETAPRDPGLDFAFLARRFKITGGNIRNIALSAAFLAADDRRMSACSISSGNAAGVSEDGKTGFRQ